MDFLLKQRLVGAVVLVALAVIFIPMLLEGPDRNLVPEMTPLPEPEDQGIGRPLERFPQAGDIPDEPERSVVQADAAGGEDSVEETGADEGAISLPLPGEDAAPAQEPAEQPVQAVEAQTSPPVAAPEPPTADAQAAGPLGNWVVQMGSFSSEQNALRLRDRLRKAGFATQVEKVAVGGKTHYRVRVGPYLERSEAEQDQKKLAASHGLKGRVLSYP